MNGSRPVRALVLVLLGYACARTAWVWTPPRPDGGTAAPSGPIRTDIRRQAVADAGDPALPAPRSKPPATSRYAAVDGERASTPTLFAALRRQDTVAPLLVGPSVTTATDSATATPITPEPELPTPSPHLDPTAPSRSRWSGYAYLFHRPAGGAAALAPGGQIGGAQAAARIAWRPADALPLALAARIATPRDTAQAEVAAGLDVLPLPGLRLSVERRVALGRGGRDAFAAYAATGLFRAVAPRLELDGYAQAGVVGARRRDPFVDAGLRLGHRTRLGETTDLRLGVGGWGAVQPDAARLDIGPRVAVTARHLPLPVTLALEGRFRVAGRARPGSGLALTLATDF